MRLVVLRIIPRGTHSLPIHESQLVITRGPPLNEFSVFDRNAVQQTSVFDTKALGVLAARFQQVSSTFPIFLVGRSQICIADDSTNKSTLQHRTIIKHCSCG